MREAKHTPGPWQTSGIDKRGVYADGGSVLLATCHALNLPLDDAGAVPAMQANARMMAAAPDLADAVRALLAEVNAAAAEGYVYGPGVGLGNRAMAKAGL